MNYDMDEIDSILRENGLTETELIFKSKVKRLRKNYPGSPTISKMAEIIGLKYGVYRLIESLTPINVKFETMEKIARTHGIPVSDLFKL